MCINWRVLNQNAKVHRSLPRTVLSWLAMCAAVLAALLSAPLAAADTAAAHRAPHEGVPDISGAWQIPQQGFVSNKALDGEEPHVVGRLTQTIPPRPPLKPEYLKVWMEKQQARAEATRRHEPIGDPSIDNCLPYGMPTMMRATFPIEILQSRKQITIINEAHNQVRRIYMNEPQVAPEDADPWYSGHSVGQWKGGTLYVDTVGFKIGLRDVPHSDQMRVREEIRLLKTGLLEDKVTVVDPVYLADNWQWAWQYERRPGYKIDEYVCENNHEYIDPKTGTQRESFVGAH
jgi:hypothetical protein